MSRRSLHLRQTIYTLPHHYSARVPGFFHLLYESSEGEWVHHIHLRQWDLLQVTPHILHHRASVKNLIIGDSLVRDLRIKEVYTLFQFQWFCHFYTTSVKCLLYHYMIIWMKWQRLYILWKVMLKVMKAQWMTTQLWNYISNDSPGDHKQNSKCITVEV